MLSQGTAILVSLVSIPLTVGYLQQERYGVWLTINSLLTWLTVTDLGFGGSALVNALAEASGKEDEARAQELVATAFWSLVVIAAFVTGTFVLVAPLIDWPSLFNTTPSVSSSELHWAVFLSVLSFALVLPLTTVTAIYQGYQEGYVGNLWATGSNIVSLLALVAVTRFEGGLAQLVLGLSGARILTMCVNAWYLFGKRYRTLVPRPGMASLRSLRLLLTLGGKYLVAQLAGLAMFQSQPFIISQLLGPAQVGIFGVAQRVVTLPLMVVQMFTFPFLPAYGEAGARGDWVWVTNTLRSSIRTAFIAGLCMILPLGLVAQHVIAWWVGETMAPDMTLVLALAAYTVLAGIATPISVMLYGLQRVGGQAMIGLGNALITVVLGVFLTRYWNVTGMAVAMTLGIVANVIGQTRAARAALSAAAAR